MDCFAVRASPGKRAATFAEEVGIVYGTKVLSPMFWGGLDNADGNGPLSQRGHRKPALTSHKILL
jgi:hypothetical protein